MKPIHKFNNGNGATLCNACLYVIIETGLTEALLCEECNTQHIYMSRIFDSEQRVLEAVKEIAEERIADLKKKR